jgi:predicted DsbA family dithiol-disulfide isomerase
MKNRFFFLFVVLMALNACSQQANEKTTTEINTIKKQKMKVEIWSDVMCPFCYIGKRKFEAALQQFKNKGEVEIVWKSFQLNPDMKTEPNKSINQYLAETKGWTLDYAKEMNNYVTNMAKEVGLTYHLDKAVVANSFDAHRLIQLAKKNGLGDLAEEHLFKAYFTDGKNTADKTVLMELGLSIGLKNEDLTQLFSSDNYSKEVIADLQEAAQLKISGVPFFVFDRKYAVSGAQNSDVFLDTLNKAWDNYSKNNPLIISNPDGKVCAPDGTCK